MVDVILTIVLAGIGPLMGYWGVHVTMHPVVNDVAKQQSFKWRFIGCAIAAAVLTGILAYSNQRQMYALQEAANPQNRFFFFRADLSDNAIPRPAIQLRAVTNEEFDVSAVVQIVSLEDHQTVFLGTTSYPLDKNQPVFTPTEIKASAAPVVGYLSNIALSTGKWRIEFRGQNHSWAESLEIFEHNGLLSQALQVVGDRVLRSEYNP
jgi:hypothetical protein